MLKQRTNSLRKGFFSKQTAAPAVPTTKVAPAPAPLIFPLRIGVYLSTEYIDHLRQTRSPVKACARSDFRGDQDGVKGVYHINAVDSVTQFQLVATCEKISEVFLIPVIQQLLDEFPFVILGFHADNGSEYINYQVAKLLEKLLVEFTKSHPRHSNDNALAESKNASVVRKHLGYAHIPQQFAGKVNVFCADFLNPYVSFHRPCFFPEIVTDAKGKERMRYRYEQMMTPYEKLKSLPKADSHLKPGVTFE